MIRPRSRCAHTSRRLQLEILEDRCLLAVTTINLPKVVLDSSYASDHILVRFLDGATPVALAGTKLGAVLDPVPNLYDVELSATITVNQALALYRHDSRVAYAEADLALDSASIPNDSQFNQQWNLQNTGQAGGTAGADIKATSAWNISTSSRQVPIAVMDTGIDYTHQDLYLNIWINQKEIPASRLKNLVDYYGDGYISMRDLNDARNQGIGKITDLNGNGYIDGGDLIAPMIKDASGNDTGNGGWSDGISQDGTGYVDDIIGWNSNANNNNPMDGYGHGTHVAGIIGAMGNNGIGVSGISWSAQLVPVKFFDDAGHGSVSQYIAGLNWALAHNIKISNNSWNDSGYTPALYDALANAASKGHLVIAAAGNGGNDTDVNPAYPADFNLDNIISVAGTDRYGNLTPWSNFGKTSVDIAAPGQDILSTLPGNQYGLKSGTSMATPHVTAVAAMVWAQHPDWTYKQVINQVLTTATPLSSLTGKVVSGELNAFAALGGSSAPTPAPTPSPAPALHIVDSAASGTTGTFSKITVKFDRAPLASTFTAADVLLTGPDGTVIPITGVTPVSGAGSLYYDLTFATQTKQGYYKVQIGPDVTDSNGGTLVVFNSSLYLNAPASAPAPTPTPTPPPVSSAPALHIVDSQASGATGTFSKITVKFDRPPLASTFTSADVLLTGPDGTVIPISNISVVAGTGNLYYDLTFATQTKGGYYKVQIGPDVTDASGGTLVVFNSSLYLNAPASSVSAPPPAPTPPPTAPALHIVDSQASGATGTFSKITIKFDRPPLMSTFTSSDITLTGPDGTVIPITAIAPVNGANSLYFDLNFATQTKAGYYKLKIGPDVTDSSGGVLVVFNSSLYLAPPTSASISWLSPAAAQPSPYEADLETAVPTTASAAKAGFDVTVVLVSASSMPIVAPPSSAPPALSVDTWMSLTSPADIAGLLTRPSQLLTSHLAKLQDEPDEQL